MLVKETLQQQELLKGLSEEQLTAIVTLSKNDEEEVIGKKIGELHGQYDKDILEITGIEKPAGEKTYNHLKQVLNTYKSKAEGSNGLQEEIESLKGKVTEYEQKLKNDKGSEVLAQKLKDAEDQLALVTKQYNDDKSAWSQKEETLTLKQKEVKRDFEIDKATSGLKFKKDIPESLHQTLLKGAKDKMLAEYKADWIEEGEKEKMVFRNAQGEIARNIENQNEPFTANELIMLNLKDVVEPPRRVNGGGGSDHQKQDNYELIDVDGASTQVEADRIIEKYLLQTGLLKTDSNFAVKQKEIRDKYNVAKKPVR